jgi:hypothetical protein
VNDPFTVVFEPFTVVFEPFTVVFESFTVVNEPFTTVFESFTVVNETFTVAFEPFRVVNGSFATVFGPVAAREALQGRESEKLNGKLESRHAPAPGSKPPPPEVPGAQATAAQNRRVPAAGRGGQRRRGVGRIVANAIGIRSIHGRDIRLPISETASHLESLSWFRLLHDRGFNQP